MPMQYLYTCPQCGAKSVPEIGLPAGWFSVSLPGTEDTPAKTEYFDTWNCLSVYAGDRVPAK